MASTIPDGPDGRVALGLAAAHALADRNVPVFCARLDANGNPDTRDRRWSGWERTPAGSRSHRAIDSWKPGDGLGAVSGTVYDILDPDLYKPGAKEAFGRLSSELGDDGPQVYWEVRTPQGGRHLYIAPLGIGSHNGFMPGIDLKGGKPDGSSRGFVFIPPTVRKGGVYIASSGEPTVVNGDGPCTALAEIVEREINDTGGTGGKRQPTSKLRSAVLSAPSGGQRQALLRYVHELERQGKSRGEIVTVMQEFLPGVRNFNGRDPWYPARGGDPDKWIKSLFHKAGAVVGDATAEEAAELASIAASGVAGSLMRSFADVPRKKTSWLIRGHLARGEMTILDGEKGVGKSLLIEDIAARLSRGESLPGMEATGEALNIAIFCSESSAETEIGPRLDAAGAVVTRIHCPEIIKDKRGKASGLVLPDAGPMIAKMLIACDADVAFFDPINSFLAEDINTNNEASIRRALAPLGNALRSTGCAALLVRHLNKDTKGDNKWRGAGSSGYQNIARIHLFAGELPKGQYNGRFGLGMVTSNLMRTDEEVLAYDIIDSDIDADDSDGKVPVLEWYGLCSVKVGELGGGEHKRMGPEPMMQEQIREVLEEMFDRQDTWPAKKVLAELKDAGCATDNRTVGKVKVSMGIRSVRHGARRGSGGVESWDWTVKTWKGKVRSNVRDEE